MTTETQEWQEESTELASGLHGFVGTRLVRYLATFVDENALGYVFGDSIDFDVPGLGSKTKKPDAAFVSIEKMAEPIDDVIPFAPDLAVEVFSRNDGWKDTIDKANLYLETGSQLVWVIDPYTESVFVFVPNSKPKMLYSSEELDGGNVVPGFKLAISKLFELPKRPNIT